jgi:hypothetical protein
MDTQFLSKPTATSGAPPGRLSVRLELMAAERLEAEGGGGGHAVTGRSHGDVQGSMRRAALFLIPTKILLLFEMVQVLECKS